VSQASTKAEKNAGLVNGRVGSVEAIIFTDDQKARVTVALDVGRGAEPQCVSFVVGENAKAGEFNAFKHGYAGTIYRGQGRTLDEAYVAHTSQWRASSSYVALTRHREAVHIFAARETVKDLDAIARGMARADNKRAATAYCIDVAETRGLEAAMAALERGGESRLRGDRSAEARPARVETSQQAKGERKATATSSGPSGLARAIRVMDAIFGALLGETIAPAPPREPRGESSAEADLHARRARFLRDYGEEIPDERQRDVEIDRTRGRERRRGE